MRILFNCSTNVEGGTSTNAANFIAESLRNCSGVEYHYAVSPKVYSLVRDHGVPENRITLFDESPSRSRRSRKLLKSLELDFNPQLVFTMAGPAYVRFLKPHLMGCSNPYIIYASWSDIRFGRNWFEATFRLIQTWYQNYHIKRADYFLFQTMLSGTTFLNKFKIDAEAHVVPNGIGSFDLIEPSAEKSELFEPGDDGMYTVLCPFQPYPHKGTHILPAIVSMLNQNGRRIRFIVTSDGPDNQLVNDPKSQSVDRTRSHVTYIGQIDYLKMGTLYSSCDIVFLPSVLEVFSSVCLEALYFKKPLIVADKVFNRDICGPYATYCDPTVPSSCIAALDSATDLKNAWDFLSDGKKHALQTFGTYSDRYGALENIFRKVTNAHQI